MSTLRPITLTLTPCNGLEIEVRAYEVEYADTLRLHFDPPKAGWTDRHTQAIMYGDECLIEGLVDELKQTWTDIDIVIGRDIFYTDDAGDNGAEDIYFGIAGELAKALAKSHAEAMLFPVDPDREF